MKLALKSLHFPPPFSLWQWSSPGWPVSGHWWWRAWRWALVAVSYFCWPNMPVTRTAAPAGTIPPSRTHRTRPTRRTSRTRAATRPRTRRNQRRTLAAWRCPVRWRRWVPNLRPTRRARPRPHRPRRASRLTMVMMHCLKTEFQNFRFISSGLAGYCLANGVVEAESISFFWRTLWAKFWTDQGVERIVGGRRCKAGVTKA